MKSAVEEGLDVDQILKMLLQGFEGSHEAKEKAIGSETMRTFEKAVMLKALDHHWKEHLALMDQLRQSVNLRGYGQKNPVQEYKRESFTMFTQLLETINIEMVKAVCSLSLQAALSPQDQTQDNKVASEKQKPQLNNTLDRQRSSTQNPSKNLKVGRNDPCPCGSGKKYKLCHG